MRHRSPLRDTAFAALLAIALTGGCAADPDEPAGPETATDAAPSGPGSSSSSSPTPGTSLAASPSAPGPTSPARRSPPTPPAPPFIAAATWADSDYGVTLEVAPTDSGRRAWAEGDAEAAWQEVLRLAPDADTPGMWEQFDCHWTWARLLEPDKPTWNVEPWRPVVSPERMLAEGCNPGGPEV
ncbi:hypothetical protein ES5_06712 [Dietzia cinnamea P4]|nr:hypothetical protein ES5_06712 [Dietzia cinnamea P4]